MGSCYSKIYYIIFECVYSASEYFSPVNNDCYGHCSAIMLCHNSVKAITIVNDSVFQP